jgi:hypothetical protein
LAELAQKLGIKPGHLVCLLEAPEEAQSALAQAVPPGASISDSLSGRGYDLILFWPRDLVGLAGRFSQLQHAIRPDGAIWAVIPKKQYARRRGVSFTWEEMQAAGLATDLVDNKVASITPEDYGTRFVIRKERRRDYG